jgi:hypothetical protein
VIRAVTKKVLIRYINIMKGILWVIRDRLGIQVLDWFRIGSV